MSTTKKSRARNRDSINPIYHYPKEPYPCETPLLEKKKKKKKKKKKLKQKANE